MTSVDPPNWVSVRLREAGNIFAGMGHTCSMRNADRLLFVLADMAEKLEREGIDPIRDPKLSMLFCHATILAAAIVEEFDGGSAKGNLGSDEGDPEEVWKSRGVPGVGDSEV